MAGSQIYIYTFGSDVESFPQRGENLRLFSHTFSRVFLYASSSKPHLCDIFFDLPPPRRAERRRRLARSLRRVRCDAGILQGGRCEKTCARQAQTTSLFHGWKW